MPSEDEKSVSLLDRMASFCCNDINADITFICFDIKGQAKRLPAHKYVLAIWSDVLKSMLYGDMHEAAEVTIDDINAEVFREFLKFLYTDQLNPPIQFAPQLLYCGKKYLIKELQEKCVSFIEPHLGLESHSKLHLLQNLLKVGERDSTLVEKCLQFIGKHGESLVASDEFSQLEEDTVALIIQRDDLMAKEESIFRALVKWGAQACIKRDIPENVDNQRLVLQRLVAHIRFPVFTADQLSILLNECKVLSAELSLQLLLACSDRNVKHTLPFCQQPRGQKTLVKMDEPMNKKQKQRVDQDPMRYNLMDRMAATWLSQTNSDVAFICMDHKGQTQRLPAHKFVLAMWSEVLKAMVYDPMQELDEVTVDDVSVEVFKVFLKFLYTDKINPPMQLAPQLLYCGKKYLIKELHEKCIFHIESFLGRFSDASLILLQNLMKVGEKETSLAEKCLQLIARNGKEAILSDKFIDLNEDTVAMIIQRDDLKAKEENIFTAIVKWSLQACSNKGIPATVENQRIVLTNLLPHIRFTTFTPDQLSMLFNACKFLSGELILDMILACSHINEDQVPHTLPKPRGQHISISVHGKKIFLIGGSIGSVVSDQIREYSPRKGCTVLKLRMSAKRQWHAAGVHPDTKELIIAGGSERDHYTKLLPSSGSGLSMVSVESYTPSLIRPTQFNRCPSIALHREQYASCVVGDRFYLFGGYNGTEYVKTCQYFDFKLRTWIAIADLPCPLGLASAIDWKDKNNQDTILLLGGYEPLCDTVFQYYVKCDRWLERTPLKLPVPLCKSAVVKIADNIILCGGRSLDMHWDRSTYNTGGRESPSPIAISGCYALDVEQSCWVKLPSMNVARCGHQAVVFQGQIIVIGGDGLKSVEVYNGKEWCMLKEIDAKLTGFAVAVM